MKVALFSGIYPVNFRLESSFLLAEVHRYVNRTLTHTYSIINPSKKYGYSIRRFDFAYEACYTYFS